MPKSFGPKGQSPTADRAGLREKPQLVADELRQDIVNGRLNEGESLGRESDLIQRFGVSRPSLREALRILEAEGLISVVRGVLGGVVVHRPDQRMTARTAALVLQSRNVTLVDVFEAMAVLEPLAARIVASSSSHRQSAGRLQSLVTDVKRAIDDPAAFGAAESRFHGQLVALAGNQTLMIVAEMLNEVLSRAVTDVADRVRMEPLATLRRAIRSKERLVSLIQGGDAAAAEEHWRAHMSVTRRLLIGQQVKKAIDWTAHI